MYHLIIKFNIEFIMQNINITLPKRPMKSNNKGNKINNAYIS